MLKTIIKHTLTLSPTLLLSACSDRRTNQGGQDSITNSFGGSGATVAVTLIFENTKN